MTQNMFWYCLLLILTQLLHVMNGHSGCGCGTNRDRLLMSKKMQFYNSINTMRQCPLELENNLIQEFAERNEDMILIPSGSYQFGTDDEIIETDKEGPKRMVKLRSFYLDKYEVSNAKFKQFILETNYKTEAEVFGDSFVFALFLNGSFKEELKDFRVMQATWWYKVNGATWRHPYGPDSGIIKLMDHPVVHVSWTDARKYCRWRGARLPTEAEWEAACRGGHKDTKYPWGNKLFPNKKHMANIWQGTFPHHNSAKDGYVGTNPVKLYPQNDYGLHNMAGNVWEWVEDTWDEKDPKEKVKKGGSYLCHRSYCYRYRCSARSHNTEDSSAGNLGFRCAKSV